MSTEYKYIIPFEDQNAFRDACKNLVDKYGDLVEDMILNNKYPFREYSVQFTYPKQKSSDIFKTCICDDGSIKIETYWDKDKICLATYKISVDNNEEKVNLDFVSLKPVGKGILCVKRDKKGIKVLKENTDSAIRYILFCPILTALKDTVYVKRKGQHFMRKGNKVADEKIYKIIDLGNHTKTKTVNTGKGGKHSYEYTQRGHWRTLKSGKKIWIPPCVKCEGRGTKPISKEARFLNVDKAVNK